MIHRRQAIRATAAGILAVTATAPAGAERWRNIGAFEYARIYVEQNATDGDIEIVIAAKPDSDDGLTSFRVLSPEWRRVLDTATPHRTGGLREFLFETPEPPGDAILVKYPEGAYHFFGFATDGRRFVASAELSHELPAATSIEFPLQDQVLPPAAMTIQWTEVLDAVQYILEFENESAEPEQSLAINLPAGVTSFDVPASLMSAGADYQVGVATVAANGNVVFVETTFSTGD